MIKLKDIRLGNWVLDYQNKPKKLTGDDLSFMLRGIYECKAVLLTKEWLLKFGFEYSDCIELYMHNKSPESCTPDDYDEAVYHYMTFSWCKDRGVFVEFSNEHGENCCMSFPKIKYVHEFQNLYFSLTGEELQIKKEVKL